MVRNGTARLAVCVVALWLGATHLCLAGKSPVGAIESVDANGRVTGWAYDPDTKSTSIKVRLSADCPAGTCLLAEIVTTVPRPDINTRYRITGNHGFTYQIPISYKNCAAHVLTAIGVDSGGNATLNRGLTNSPASFRMQSSPEGTLEGIDLDPGSPGGGVVTGWAYDCDDPTRSINVQILVDCTDPASSACYVGQYAASISRSDIPRPGNHGFRVTLPARYLDGVRHKVHVLAVDSTAAQPNALLTGSSSAFLWDTRAHVLGGIPIVTNLRYYGFFAVADQPNTGPRNMKEVMYHTNLIFMQEAVTGGVNDLPSKLALARAMGQSVLLDVTWQFFTRETYNGQNVWVMRPDHDAVFTNFTALIAPYADVITAFFVMDEPYWTSPTRPPSAIRTELESVATRIKQSFPEAAVVTNFAWPTLLDSMTGTAPLLIPRNFDWLGFDCYGSFDACGSDSRGRRSITQYATHLKSLLSPGQQILLVPAAGTVKPPGATAPLWSEDDAVRFVDSFAWLAYGVDSPVRDVVVAITPFLWETRNLPDGFWTGARDLPKLKARYQALGFSVLPASNRAGVGDLNGLAGSILRGWALDPDTPARSIDVELRFDGGARTYRVTAGAPRLDVNRGMQVQGKHGIEFALPGELQDCHVHNVELRVYDATSGILGPMIDTLCIAAPGGPGPCQQCP